MTLMKSILFGSAAGIVAVAGAQAADLPTKKAAPAEYVKICNVGGMAGFVLPGSDTCLKISGYITGQVEGGNTTKSYAWVPYSPKTGPSFAVAQKAIAPNALNPLGVPAGGIEALPGKKAVFVGQKLTSSSAKLDPQLGWTTRANIDFDARQMTSYGVLRGYAELQFENGNGINNTGNSGYINLAYVQWAGITAGKAPSFFAFYGGGEAWSNILSPDGVGFSQPDVLAYTATFGGGFSATLSLQSNQTTTPAAGTPAPAQSGNGNSIAVDTKAFGMTVPDVVGVLRVDQGWGSAQVSGVAHKVDIYETATAPTGGATLDKWGWGVGGGLSFNLPSIGAGDKLSFQGDYSKNAIFASGLPDAQWSVFANQVNGNGIGQDLADAYFAPADPATKKKAVWATPTAWSVGATLEHHFSPVFSIDPEASYGELNWSNSNGQLSDNSQIWVVGSAAHWDPVPLLDFEVELLYQNAKESTPGLWKTVGTIDGKKAAFPGTTDGWAGRFEVTRNF